MDPAVPFTTSTFNERNHISIPEEVLAQVDKEAGLKHISRAQFIRDRLVAQRN